MFSTFHIIINHSIPLYFIYFIYFFSIKILFAFFVCCTLLLIYDFLSMYTNQMKPTFFQTFETQRFLGHWNTYRFCELFMFWFLEMESFVFKLNWECDLLVWVLSQPYFCFAIQSVFNFSFGKLFSHIYFN